MDFFALSPAWDLFFILLLTGKVILFHWLFAVVLCCFLHSRIIQVMGQLFTWWLMLPWMCLWWSCFFSFLNAVVMLFKCIRKECYICTLSSCLSLFDRYCFFSFADYHHWSQSCNRSHWGCKSRVQGCSCRIWRNHNQDAVRKGIYKVDMLLKPFC